MERAATLIQERVVVGPHRCITRSAVPSLATARPRSVKRQHQSLLQAPRAAHSPDPAPSPNNTPASSSAPESLILEGTKLTTWEYSRLKDPGFAPWFVGMAFLPFLLLLVPLLSSPPMPPVPSP